MNVVVNIHKKADRTVVAVCDEDLMGRRFEEGDRVLDLSSEFFQGEVRDVKVAGDVIRNADVVTLVGEGAVRLGLDEGIIEKEHVKRVQSVPYAQALLA